MVLAKIFFDQSTFDCVRSLIGAPTCHRAAGNKLTLDNLLTLKQALFELLKMHAFLLEERLNMDYPAISTI